MKFETLDGAIGHQISTEKLRIWMKFGVIGMRSLWLSDFTEFTEIQFLGAAKERH